VRRPAPRAISLALGELTSTLAPATTLAAVQEVWERAVGPAIAAASRPVSERAGVLTVLCDAAVWAQELELMGEQLIARINAELGAESIERLRCRTGPL
jgi:predicted nucleic acid-binding Zn ribbon protein